ncbi:hypothetical protein [Paludisphaera mucosa]|uniref:ACAD9/ACADV-like C-terminal domain-containing protein n=1 Tax=Paludisphaera mucosa TaxID=3030827 RepID=A0ABT6FA84_9BACT|nr:hypothetical protein [Paludisphaera mucosa]MDG3004500.1 hypothetical protein [Paludisphaera mucosa]
MAIETDARGAEAGAGGDAAAGVGPGFVLGLFFGEFRGDLVFPYPGPPLAAAPGDFPRRDGAAVGYCRNMGERFAELVKDGPAAAAEGLEAWGCGLVPVGDAASFDHVLRTARLGLLARAQLGGAVARVRGETWLLGSESAAAVLARLAGAAYALEASAFEAAGWLDRGVVDFRTAARASAVDPRVSHIGVETSFLETLCDRVATPAALDALQLHEPFGRAILGRRRVDASPAGWGLAAVGRSLPKSLGGFWSFVGRRLARSAAPPLAPVATPMLRPLGEALCRRTAAFGRAVERAWAAFGGSILARDGLLGHVDGAVVELASSACVLARLDASAASGTAPAEEHAIAELYLRDSGRRFDAALRALARDPDREAVAAGRTLLLKHPRS